jgi:hypothetical protein
MSLRQLPSGGMLTHVEIGEILGISRARVFQLEHRALQKIRHALLREAAAVGLSVDEFLEGEETQQGKDARVNRRLRAEFDRSLQMEQ